MHVRLLLAFALASLFLSTPSISRIPRFLPLLQRDVRNALPQTVDALQKKGLWLVNTDLLSIEQRELGICFRWAHRYTSGSGTKKPKTIITCAPRRRVTLSGDEGRHAGANVSVLRLRSA